ncbi:Hypothetical predicted protein [Lecanosticta acicola]|uniref:Uncharacterized protein n=1 Tax=Lecanosticta acicola TaxID=111012 RepID=A0AAI9EA83_9PEZI|nr:Hypothetical predicted protein [Lecanosticta acicola]
MFSRRAPHHTRTRSTSNYSPNVPPAAAPSSSFAHAYGHGNRAASQSSVEPPLVSPLQMTFDFELDVPPPSSPQRSLPSPPSSSIAESPARPKTSHGVPSSESNAKWSSLQPPMLPPIPRVASQNNSTRSRSNSAGSEEQDAKRKGKARDETDNISLSSKKSALKARLSFEHPLELMPPLSRPTTAGGSTISDRPQTAGRAAFSNHSTPNMESSLFPSKNNTPVLGQVPTMPAMSRQFIDSRDRPYSQPTQKPFAMQHNHSSPNLRGPQSGVTNPSPIASAARNWTRPQASMHNLSQKSNGTTARPSTQASALAENSSSPAITIGTPYNATADSFPLPQLVKTRPKTQGQTATVAGVSVPTHYTHGAKNGQKPNESKRKTRLLNPLSLLQRRRSNQDPELAEVERSQRQAQAQALARQRDVVTSGVYKPPPDFDPRIKGNVVHDFSAPRGKRNTFDERDVSVSPYGVQGSSAISSPSTPGYPPRNTSLHNRDEGAGGSQKRSTHTPVFMEHLSENPEAASRISSIHAENLENKDFLQRASKNSSVTTYSQESAVLPPFARRSQNLDPMQASFYNDDESKSSSDPPSDKERHSTLSTSGQVSPINGRGSRPDVEARATFSPVSPNSEGKLGTDAAKTRSQYRPLSDVSGVPSQDDSNRPMSQVSKVSSLDKQSKHLSDATARPESVVLAPPAIDTIAEGSSENSPLDVPSRQASSLEPQVLAQAVSFGNPGTPSPVHSTGLQPIQGRSAETSPATQSLLERTANMSTPDRTPEPELVESIQFRPSKDQPKLVEKRASAVGHSRKASNGPKHHASNASRFSFQYGTESAAQEQALEDKHRKMSSREIAQTAPRGRSPEEDDEDDYFDEDAMDDMDEMEMQASQHPSTSGEHLNLPMQSSMYLQKARQALQLPDSDDGSVYDEEVPNVTREEELPYPDHPAWRTHSALWNDSRHNSYQTADGYWRGSTIDRYMRDSYMPGHAAGLGIDPTHLFANNAGEHQNEHLSPNDKVPGSNRSSGPRSNIYMQPQAAQQSTTIPSSRDGPPVPARDSGNSERNRAASGISFASGALAAATATATEKPSVTTDEDHGASDRARHLSDMSYSTASDDARSSRAAISSANVTVNAVGRESGMSQRSGGLASPLSSPQFEEDTLASLEGDKTQRNDSADSSADAISLASPKEDTLVGRSNTAHSEDDVDSNDAFSLASPDKAKSTLAHRSVASGMSLESFARDGSSRVGIPASQTGVPGQLGTTDALSSASNNLITSNSSGLGTFSGFDFQNSPPAVRGSEHFSHEGGTLGSPHALGSLRAAKKAQESLGSRGQGKQSDAQEIASATSVSSRKQEAGNLSNTFGGFVFDEQSESPPGRSGNEIYNSIVSHSSRASAGTEGQIRTGKHHELSQFSSGDRAVSPTGGINSFGGFDFGNKDRNFTVNPSQTGDLQKTYETGSDDMYFDDGNFAEDINGSHRESIDENAFDDDAFLARPGMFNGGVNHRRDRSSAAFTVNSLGSEGPYPSFAIPNAARASARLSSMMLEDLPLLDADTAKFIPQRNPSEDMKRLGMSKKVPPVPVPESDKEAFNRMQASLQSYHATLADAANRAAAEGRFLRAPSNATSGSTRVVEDNKSQSFQDDRSIYDDKSIYSNDESCGKIAMPYANGNEGLGRSNTAFSHLTHTTNYSPPKMSFDFGFDQPLDDDYDDAGSFENDEDLVAAANAEVLASDDEGFYGQEFDFYGRPRANSGDLAAINGGFFGQDGDDGLIRNKSLKEPNLTPITERSEFSTRNSFIGLGMSGPFGPASASAYGPHSPALARMPMMPLYDTEVTSFDELRKLKANTFSGGGGSNSSLHSQSNRSSQQSLQAAFSPVISTKPQMASPQGYFGGTPMQFGYSTDSNGSNSNPNSARPISNQNSQDSPRSTASSNGLPFAMDVDSTPKRNTGSAEPPTTARKVPPSQHSQGQSNGNIETHSRNGSGADSVTYVREPDPENNGRPRWVLERRRTSEQGNLELIGRELVQGGWI